MLPYFPPGPQLPSQPYGITLPLGQYQSEQFVDQHTGVSNLPKVTCTVATGKDVNPELLIASPTLYQLRHHAT